MSREEEDGWLYFDGPEPEQLRPTLDALRDLPPATAQDRQRAVRRFQAMLFGAQAREDQVVSAALGAETSEEHEGGSAGLLRAGGMRLGVMEEAEAMPEVVVTIAEAQAETPAEAPVSAGARAPEGLAGTGLALELPREVWEQRGKLPFGEAPPDRPKSAKTQKVPVMRSKLGETAPIDDARMAQVVAALPFGGSTLGAGAVPFPRLTLEQYASLRAELSVGAEPVGEILLRYRVLHEAALGALDAHWEKVLREQAGERAKFEKLLGEFSAWVRARRGR